VTAATRPSGIAIDAIPVALPAHPGWLAALLFGATASTPIAERHGVAFEARDEGAHVAIRATVRGADRLGDEALRGAVRRSYSEIGRWLDARGLSPWRWWNYLPRIAAPARLAADRYQVFNVGRFDALGDLADGRLAAASAVGCAGADLIVDVLAGPIAGAAVESPRQRPSTRYSKRWGPRPPCFARAVVLPARAIGWSAQGDCALVSGTASIVGEDSMHAGDLAAQLDETCANLAALAPLRTHRALRAYVREPASAAFVAAELRRRFSALDALELAIADLCRRELLVEIEGVAVLDA
jgi:chorismate lyase/3-hydroxybenzoate synthase